MVQTLWVDPHSGLKTMRNSLRVDRGVSFDAALQRLELDRTGEDGSGFFRSKRPWFGRTLVLLAVARAGPGHMFSICRPNTGAPASCLPWSALSPCATVCSGFASAELAAFLQRCIVGATTAQS